MKENKKGDHAEKLLSIGFIFAIHDWHINRVCMGMIMEIDIIFKIALVGILVSLLNQILKQTGREEQAFFVNIAGLILVLFWIIPYISDVFKMIKELFELGG